MREPHRSIEAGTVRLTPYLFAVNQLEATQPPALTFLMLQAATMICQERAHRFFFEMFHLCSLWRRFAGFVVGVFDFARSFDCVHRYAVTRHRVVRTGPQVPAPQVRCKLRAIIAPEYA